MTFGDLSRKPNLLLIVTDQEREVMHWPAGWAEANLPARSRLLANGLQFTRAQCNTAACSASRATFFTGLYPAQHGVKNIIACDNPKDRVQSRLPVLPSRLPNLATVMAAAGYHVVLKGKFHHTRRVIEAFPEAELFRFSVGGMRPFSAMALEDDLDGLGRDSRNCQGGLDDGGTTPASRPQLAARDAQRAPANVGRDDRANRRAVAGDPGPPFRGGRYRLGQYEGVIYALLLYWIDNEIHHRGQGYVYLRALGIEPPAFYDRS